MVVGKSPQRTSERFDGRGFLPSDDVRAIVVCGSNIYFGTSRGVGIFDGKNWNSPAALNGTIPGEITKLACGFDGADLLIGTTVGLFAVRGQAVDPAPIVDRPVFGLSAGKDVLAVGTTTGLFLVDVQLQSQRVAELEKHAVTDTAIDADGNVWIGYADGLVKYDTKMKSMTRFGKGTNGTDGLLHDTVRSLFVSPDGTLYIGTPVGISKFDRKGKWDYITGKHGGLPYEDVLVVAGSADTLWVGTTIGACRFNGSEWHYFQSGQYLADDTVSAIAITPDGDAWLGTHGGPTRVRYVMMSLEDKARVIEDYTRARHNRYGLFSGSDLSVKGDLSTNVMQTDDNDGLWTGMYIAAECYRYGATGDPEAKKFARESLDSLMFLHKVTETPHFVARSFAKPDEPHCNGEWDHITSDGKWRWKGDTSSDEIDGHMYAYSVYYDVCADENEKKEIATYVDEIMSGIVDNNFFLIDTDGKPTSWGRWNPDDFKGTGYFLKGLNSLEILSYLKTAEHITGDPKYTKAYRYLIKEHNYAHNMVMQKLSHLGIINHSDDELAFLAYYPLLKYETHPFLLEYYHKSLQRSWEIERPEKNPLFNFIYATEFPGGFDLEESIWMLRRIPLTGLRWAHRNSHRADIIIDTSVGRFKEAQSVEILPFDERTLHLWNENPYRLDGWWGDGTNEQPGTFYLLPYWMGRYYGFIVEADTQQ